VRITAQNHLRRKLIFSWRINPITSSSPSRKKIPLSFFQKLMFSSVHPASLRGAFRDRHGRWARDAMACSGWRARFAGGRPAWQDGEVVWSWRPDAGVKFAMMLAHHADDGG
jgi:hypothetical protein